MGSIRGKAHPLPQTHKVTVSTPVGRWNVTHGFDSRESSQAANTHIAKVSISVGRWMKVQGKGRRRAHVKSRVVMDIAAFKVSYSIGADIDTTTLRAKKWSASRSIGAMDESSGKGSKMQAHISSGVVMDIAAFKVCHPVGGDKDATALQAKKWSA